MNQADIGMIGTGRPAAAQARPRTEPAAAATAAPLRILHVLDHSIPLQSGYTFRTLSILTRQRAMGWDTVHLTTPRHVRPGADGELVSGLRFHRTPAPPGWAGQVPGLREWLEIEATTRRLLRLARETRPDILHAHSPALNAIPAIRVGRRLGIPVVYEIRAFWEDAAVSSGATTEGSLRYRLTRALESWAVRRADWVTTICEGLRRDLIARGVPAGRLTVIPNGVDVEEFTGPGAPDPELARRLGLDGKTVIGFIGSFYAYEGLGLLLEAMAKLRAGDPDLRLLLVGGGPEEAKLRALAERLGLGPSLVLTGRVPHEEVQRYYDLVDILVYPRLPERITELVTPLKPLEAMAQHKIVVASDVGGHRELIADGVTGTLFRAGDSQALAEALTRTIEGRAEWPGRVERARRFVETERNWESIVARYRQVYETLAGRGGPGAVPATASKS